MELKEASKDKNLMLSTEKPIEPPTGDLPQPESKEASNAVKPIEPPAGNLPQAESKEASNGLHFCILGALDRTIESSDLVQTL